MNDRKSAAMDLTEGRVFWTLVVFSFPFVISTVLQTLYNTVDMMVVGNFVGKEGLSALSIGTQFMEMITVFCVGFSSAGQVLISQYIGAGERERAKKVTGTLMVMMIGLAVVFTAVGVIGCDRFLGLLNTPQESFAHAHSYVTICCLGIVFTSLYNMVSAVFRGMGDSRHPLYFIAIASVINIGLDLLFVAGFRWGAAGAALATVIGQAVSVICSFVMLYRNQEEYLFSFDKSIFHLESKIAVAMIKLGVPMALQTSAVYISFLFVNSMVNALGVTVSATFGASMKIRNLPNMLTQAVGMGATAMMGQNIGAGNMDRVKKIYQSSLVLCMIACLLFALPYVIAPEGIFRLFTSDTAVLAYAKMCMFCILIELPAKFFMSGGGALINASGFVKLSMTLALCDAFVGRVFLTWLLGMQLGMGEFGYFMGYGLATYITSIPQIIYYLSGRWRNRSNLI